MHAESSFATVLCGKKWEAVIIRILLLLPLIWAGSAFASGAGPNGINIGFDINWNLGPNGYSASFINNDGSTLNNCGGPVSASTTACNFALTYSIGGASQTAVSSGGVYDTWAGTCNTNPAQSSPLTLYNCFNQNSYGQIFMASSSGALSNVTMRMTCLNPSGQPITGLKAYLYLINPDGKSLPSAPLTSVPVDLSSCPTATDWTNKTFSAADFANIPLSFSGVNIEAGKFYGIFFGGSIAPGAPLPGTTVQNVPALSHWSAVALASLLALVTVFVLSIRRSS